MELIYAIQFQSDNNYSIYVWKGMHIKSQITNAIILWIFNNQTKVQFLSWHNRIMYLSLFRPPYIAMTNFMNYL